MACRHFIAHICLSDSLYEDEEELDDEGDEASYLDHHQPSSHPRLGGGPENNNNVSPDSPAGQTTQPDKSPGHRQQADSSTERDPNDSEGELVNSD